MNHSTETRKWVAFFPLRKVVIILFVSFGMKLLLSCTPPPPIDLHYNSVSVEGIDNGGKFLRNNVELDTMYTDAVALKLTIADTSLYYASYQNKLMEPFRIPSAMAFSYHQEYTPVDKIKQIKVLTLFDINDTIKAGADISEHFLYAIGFENELYVNETKAISKLNAVQGSSVGTVEMVFTKSVVNTQARFNIQITLENGTELSGSSKTLHIIES